MTPNTQKRVARIHAALRNELARQPRIDEDDARFIEAVKAGRRKFCEDSCEKCAELRWAANLDQDRDMLRRRATALVMRAMSRTWGAYVLKAGPL